MCNLNFIVILFIFAFNGVEILAQSSKEKDDNFVMEVIADNTDNYKIFYQSEVLESHFSGTKHLDSTEEHIDFLKDTSFDNAHVMEKIGITITYFDGIKVKSVAYYNNGQIREVSEFNRKGLNGKKAKYFKNGVLFESCFYKNDTLISPIISWYNNRSLMSVESFNDIYWIQSWYPSGSKMQDVISVKLKSNRHKEILYSEDGTVTREAIYNCGIQPFSEYYSSGKKKIAGSILNFEENHVGTWKYWHENGLMIEEQYYHESIPNLRIKTWKYYNEKGELIKEEIYKEGELQETKEYLPLNLKKE